MKESLGILEVTALTPTLVAVDAMEKAANVRVIQCELNDFYGVCVKVAGPAGAVRAAIEAGCRIAESMGGNPIADVILRTGNEAMKFIVAAREFSPLIQQDVVFLPQEVTADCETSPRGTVMSQEKQLALGLIETQGFTAVFEAIDTACKAANVEVVAKEKLGGGYITVVVRGDLSAVTAAIEAGKAKVEGLGKLIAAHVIAHPSPAVLNLLPKL